MVAIEITSRTWSAAQRAGASNPTRRLQPSEEMPGRAGFERYPDAARSMPVERTPPMSAIADPASADSSGPADAADPADRADPADHADPAEASSAEHVGAGSGWVLLLATLPAIVIGASIRAWLLRTRCWR